MPILTRNDAEIYYQVSGEGPVILLTHGFGADHNMWSPQIGNHNPAHNKILEYDHLESLIGKQVTDFWQFPEDRTKYKEQILKDGYVKNYICPSLTKNCSITPGVLNDSLISFFGASNPDV